MLSAPLLTLVLLAGLPPQTVTQTTIAKAPAERRAFVNVTRAHVRSKPSKSAKSVAILPIATEVAVIGKRRGGYSRVRLASGVKGFMRFADLVSVRPTLHSLLERLERTPPGQRLRRTLVERATALAPGDLDVIERLQAELESRGDKKWTYYARKGWIAAKRRTFMWDGPLYPIVDQRAALPLPCAPRASANAGRRPAAIMREELRARAFPVASSGKVVSVTAKKNVTQKLSEPLCDAGSLAYRLPKKVTDRRVPDGRGALVPSWFVAGHTVLPFFAAKRSPNRFSAGDLAIDIAGEAMTLTEQTLDGVVAHPVVTLPTKDATPVAVMFDETTQFRVLFWSPHPHAETPACATAGPSAFVVRYALAKDSGPFASARALAESRTQVDVGRVWASRAPPGCDVPQFKPLPGEPRDISHEKLESSSWKQ